jgi:hypothetical protein
MLDSFVRQARRDHGRSVATQLSKFWPRTTVSKFSAAVGGTLSVPHEVQEFHS